MILSCDDLMCVSVTPADSWNGLKRSKNLMDQSP